tara:strand:- start:1408 stop:1572 length:165 start_codon:yes stop_codon:yes gene_type:complete
MINQNTIDTVIAEVTDLWNDRELDVQHETFEETLFWYLSHLNHRVIEDYNKTSV